MSVSVPYCRRQLEQVGRQHGIAVLPIIATLDPEQHALAVDIAALEARNLDDAHAGRFGGAASRCKLDILTAATVPAMGGNRSVRY